MTERARLLPLKIREHQPGGKDHRKAGDAHGKVDIKMCIRDRSKTAEKWGVNVRFTITKNEGYEEEVSISGFGGA